MARNNIWFDRFRSHSEDATAAERQQSFQPRAPRFYLEVPASFAVNGREHHGKCINVSESGLLARFNDPPELWTNGIISLESGEYFLSIQARVARLLGKDVAFAFMIHTDNDRAAIRILVDSVLAFPITESFGRE